MKKKYLKALVQIFNGATTFFVLLAIITPYTVSAAGTLTLTIPAGTTPVINQVIPLKVTTSDKAKDVTLNFQASEVTSLTDYSKFINPLSCKTDATGSCTVSFASSISTSFVFVVKTTPIGLYTSLASSPLAIGTGNTLLVSVNPQNIKVNETSTITVSTSDKKAGVLISFPGATGNALSPSSCTTTAPAGACSVQYKAPLLFSGYPINASAPGYASASTIIGNSATSTPVTPAAPTSNEPNTSAYTLLEPIGNSGKTFDAGNEHALGNYLNTMIRLFIGICAILAMIMIVIGGLEYMTSELISSKEHGRERITNAIFGLLLALGSYALLNTINPDLLIVEPKIPLATLMVLGDDVPQTPINNTYTAPGISYNAGTTWTSVGAVPALPSRTTVSPTGDCSSVGQQHCTSLRGFNFSIVNDILTNCPSCSVTITGGTEFWLHSTKTTHKPGSSTVDFRESPAINTYINGSSAFPTGKTITKNGIKYWAEEARGNQPSHWHAYQ